MSGERRFPGLGLWGAYDLGSGGWKPGYDENGLLTSAIIQGAVISRTVPLPASPANGSIYIVPAGASDTANRNKVAVRDNGAWTYFTPKRGWRLFALDTGTFVYFDNGWIEEDAGEVYAILGLSDVPDTYGSPGQVLAVNPLGSGMIFVDPPEGSGGGGGGIEEAPEDGIGYVRKDGTWAAEEIGGGGGGGGVEEAPADGFSYVRKDEEWSAIAVDVQDPNAPRNVFKYWRIRPVKNADGQAFVGIAEIKFDGVVATGGLPFASSEYNDGTTYSAASKAFDGNPATNWGAASGTWPSQPAWIGYVFPTARAFESVEITGISPLGYQGQTPTEFYVECSADGVDYLTSAKITTGAWTAAAEVRAFPFDAFMGYQAVQKVSEAPADGKLYGRKDAAWIVIPSDAPKDTFKFWRIKLLSSPDGTYAGVGDLQFRKVAGVPEKPTGGSPIQGSNYFNPSGNGVEAFDGALDGSSIGSRWASGQGSMATGLSWVGYNYPAPVKIVEVYIVPQSPNSENPSSFGIEGSDDGLAWTRVKTYASVAFSGSPLVFDATYVPPPVVREANTDGKSYVRKDGAWVEAGVAAIRAVNAYPVAITAADAGGIVLNTYGGANAQVTIAAGIAAGTVIKYVSKTPVEFVAGSGVTISTTSKRRWSTGGEAVELVFTALNVCTIQAAAPLSEKTKHQSIDSTAASAYTLKGLMSGFMRFSGNVTLTLPNVNSGDGCLPGMEFTVFSVGGIITFVGGGSVTIQRPAGTGLVAARAGELFRCIMVSDYEWIISGNLATA